ncbi:MAG: SPOR domain-containing protein [Pseudomonadota bacterium]|nr:SPOR domain-containing protein [Pseudomonadota bacterium]MED5422776.1 SPOR domain-containing protein [Pseudomonadota bacterium]
MKLNAILLISAVVIVSALMWYSNTQKTDTVPIIRGDHSPIKERPDERGGMDIAHSDSTIYDSIRNENSKQRVENLLAENQNARPQSREELFAGLKTQNTTPQSEDIKYTQELKDDEGVNSRIAGAVPIDEERPAPVAEKEAPTVTTVTHATPTARPAQVKESSKNTKNEFKTLLAEVQGLNTTPIQERKANKPSTPPQGTHYVQLGSLSSNESAQKHWQNRLKEFPDLLAGMKLRIQTAEITGKGTYYRVQAGEVSKSHAAEICSKINAKHAQSCIVK